MKSPILMAALAVATLALPASAALVASYTFDSGTVSGAAVTNVANPGTYNGTLVSSSIVGVPTALAGDGSLDVTGSGSRMTIDGGSAILDGWKGIDVQATINLDTVSGQLSLINVGHAGSTFATRFRFTVRDGGKLMVGLRFTDNSSANFLGYYAGDFNTTVLTANTSYDIGVAVDATNAASGTPGTVQFRYRLAGTPTWTYLAGSLSGTSSGNNIADWRNGWTGLGSGTGVGSRIDGSGENFDGRIDNLTISQIPEPGSFVLLGLSGLLLARRKR